MARRLLIVLVAAGGLVVTTTGWLTVCDQRLSGGAAVEVCRAPQITDGITLAFGLVLLVLLLPDLAEIGVPGVLSIRREVDAQQARLEVETGRRELLEQQLQALQATVVSSTVSSAVSSTTTVGPSALTINVPGLDSARLAAADPDPDEEVPAPVAQARYAAAEYLLGHLLEEPSAVLGDVRLNVFLPVDDGDWLFPALVTDDAAAEAQAWEHGEGIVGQAWASGEPVSARGSDILRGLDRLPESRRAGYGKLSVVVAVPLLNDGGQPVGVLSAVSVDAGSELDGPAGLGELLTRADVLSRVLIDLLGWASDEPDDDPAQGGNRRAE